MTSSIIYRTLSPLSSWPIVVEVEVVEALNQVGEDLVAEAIVLEGEVLGVQHLGEVAD